MWPDDCEHFEFWQDAGGSRSYKFRVILKFDLKRDLSRY